MSTVRPVPDFVELARAWLVRVQGHARVPDEQALAEELKRVFEAGYDIGYSDGKATSAEMPGSQSEADRPRLTGIMPGALMYRRAYPAGVPDVHTTRTAHLHVAGTAAAFASLPSEEREALFESLGKTVRRASYHRIRYSQLRAELGRRRERMPGHVFWDEFVEALHAELQAFCGATRTVVDELFYLVARRHGVAPKKAAVSPWDANELMTKNLPTSCQVAEVMLARSLMDWFALVNAYRNTFIHHGWRHGAGHFADDDIRAAVSNPAANALLVPDRASLRDRRRPHERTYVDGTTVDDVMSAAQAGLDKLLRELCEGPWNTPEPAPGQLPREQQANMLVMLVQPALFVVAEDLVVIPFFTTEHAARRFGAPGPEIELVGVTAGDLVVEASAVTFSLKGLDLGMVPKLAQFKVLVDPVVVHDDWRNVTCAAAIDVDVRSPSFDPIQPLSIPVPDGTRLYVWGAKDSRAWR